MQQQQQPSFCIQDLVVSVYLLANEMTTYSSILLEGQRCFNALTFRGIDVLLYHITLGPFENSSLSSSQNISWNCVPSSYFPRNL